jgi:tetraacyldisaccharide-1-P 4'-kinase
LQRADQLALIHQTETSRPPVQLGHPVLRRQARCVRDLSTGQVVDTWSCPPVLIAAAVGEPSSVAICAREFGLTVKGSLPIRDHGRPSLTQRGALDTSAGHAVLITEKDAFGWAALSPLKAAQTLVLSMDLAGSHALATVLLDRLMGVHPRA